MLCMTTRAALMSLPGLSPSDGVGGGAEAVQHSGRRGKRILPGTWICWWDASAHNKSARTRRRARKTRSPRQPPPCNPFCCLFTLFHFPLLVIVSVVSCIDFHCRPFGHCCSVLASNHTTLGCYHTIAGGGRGTLTPPLPLPRASLCHSYFSCFRPLACISVLFLALHPGSI